MARSKLRFPRGIKVPRLLADFATLVASCDDYISGELELADCDATVWFRNNPEVADQFAVFGHDGEDSLYALWLHDKLDAEHAPVVYLNSEGCDSSVIAGSLREFLGLLAFNYERIGAVKEWRTKRDPANAKTLAKLLAWLRTKNIAIPAKPKTVVTAARKAHPDLEKWIAARAAASEPAAPEASSNEALCEAICDDDVAAVKNMLAAGTPANAARTETQPLAAAAEAGNAAIVKLLLAHGADPNHKHGEMDSSPFAIAVRTRDAAIVKLLRAAGAKLTLEAFLGACEAGDIELIEAALAAGMSPNAHDLVTTPLAHAAENGQTKAVALLLERGADVNRATPDGSAPIVGVGGLGDPVGTLTQLLDAGADLEATDPSYGRTAFLNAVYLQAATAEPVLRLLAKRGANIHAKDARKRTAIQCATDKKIKAVLRSLEA